MISEFVSNDPLFQSVSHSAPYLKALPFESGALVSYINLFFLKQSQNKFTL